MTIFRTRKQARFTTVDNAPFQDKRLRWDTRGLLAYLLTKPDGWEIRIEDLLKQEAPEDGGRATGKEKIFRMLRELKRYGYLYRTQENGPDGKFVTVCIIYENPADNPFFGQDADDESDDDELTVVGFPDHGETAVGKAVHGKAVHGKPVTGAAVNGKDDRIVNTDLSVNTDQVNTDLPAKNERGKTDPPHIRQMEAMYGTGLNDQEKELQRRLREAFGFFDHEECRTALDQMRSWGATAWTEDNAALLAGIKKVSKGVKPLKLFEAWFVLWREDAGGEEVVTLFGPGINSWWKQASGMMGMPWPSQVAHNISVARYWLESRDGGTGETAEPGRASSAMSSLQQFASRVADNAKKETAR